MKLLSATEVHAHMVAALNLDPTILDLSSTEALANALRRAAGFLCPCPERTLIRAVTRPLNGLLEEVERLEEMAKDTLEALIAYGDLFEFRDVVRDDIQNVETLIYTAPPAYVPR